MFGAVKMRSDWSLLGYAVAFSAASTLADPPTVQFDVPASLTAQDVIDSISPGTSRLVEVAVPVSVRVAQGDVRDVEQVTIEVDGGASGVVVHDFAPQTALGSEHTDDIRVTKTEEKSKHFDGSFGGQSPIPIGGVTAQVTPSLSAGNKNRTTETTSTSRFAPKKPVVVSGTLNAGRGAFFQLRPSSQTTLEGQHPISLVLRVPEDWDAGQLEVRCWARGERKILWYDQQTVWGSMCRKVVVKVAGLEPPQQFVGRHVVAKQPTKAMEASWVPARGAETDSTELASASDQGLEE